MARVDDAQRLATEIQLRVLARLQSLDEAVCERWSEVELQRLLNEVVGLPLDTPHPPMPLERLADYILCLLDHFNLP